MSGIEQTVCKVNPDETGSAHDQIKRHCRMSFEICSRNRKIDPGALARAAAQALNDAARRGGPALRGISLVNQAMLGLEPRRDLPGLVRAVGSATEQLGRSERSLQDFVTALDTTAGAFAAQSGDLARSVALLPVALGRTRTAFTGLTATLPAVRTFATGFTDVARQLPAVYRYAPAWITATEGLLTPRRFGGVARDLRLLAAPLAGLVPAQTALAGRIDASAACGARVVLPTLATRLDDGSLSTGQPNYEELLRAFTGLAGSAQNFDGNGDILHVLAGSGNTIVKAGPGGQPGAKSFGGWAIEPPTGTSPRFPGVERRTSYDMQFPRVPPIRTDVPCATQARPDVNGPLSTGPPDRSAPRSP